MMRIRSITTLEEWSAWRERWQRLLDRAGPPFVYLTHEWIETWWQHFGRQHEVDILVAEDEEGPAGALPLMRSAYGKAGLTAKCLEFIGAPFRGHLFARCMDLPIARQRVDCLGAICEYLREHRGEWDFANLRRFPVASENLAALHQMAPQFGLRLRAGESHSTYLLPLGCSWEELLARQTGHFRNNLRYSGRRLNALGKVTMEDYATPEEVSAALPEIVELIGQSWQGGAGTSWVSEPAIRDFYLAVLLRLSEVGQVRLSAVRLEGRMICYAQLLTCKDYSWFRDTVYHPDFKQGAPGINLLARLVQWSCENGLAVMEMGGGLQYYKRVWSEQTADWRSAIIFHGGLRSRALEGLMFGSSLVRRALNRGDSKSNAAPAE